MTRLLALPVLCGALGLGAWIGSGSAAGGGSSVSGQRFDVRPGDRIQVVGTPLGCRVVRVRELGRRVAVDCRRGGPLAGTYGTLVTAREAVVVEFKDPRTAKLVFVAKHAGEARRCD